MHAHALYHCILVYVDIKVHVRAGLVPVNHNKLSARHLCCLPPAPSPCLLSLGLEHHPLIAIQSQCI